MLKGENITWKYGLKNASFHLRKGRITTFMGPSGAGKTTLLKCIANLYPSYQGSIQCSSEDILHWTPAKRAAKIGFVFQQWHLFPHLTVLQNCMLPLVESAGLTTKEAQIRSLPILDTLQMSERVYALPSQLSGGQQQRAAIARALVLQPDILLLDEPTSALDPESKSSLEKHLLELQSRGMTLALSSHDMPFIRKMLDYVYFMEQGEVLECWDAKQEPIPRKINQYLFEE